MAKLNSTITSTATALVAGTNALQASPAAVTQATPVETTWLSTPPDLMLPDPCRQQPATGVSWHQPTCRPCAAGSQHGLLCSSAGQGLAFRELQCLVENCTVTHMIRSACLPAGPAHSPQCHSASQHSTAGQQPEGGHSSPAVWPPAAEHQHHWPQHHRGPADCHQQQPAVPGHWPDYQSGDLTTYHAALPLPLLCRMLPCPCLCSAGWHLCCSASRSRVGGMLLSSGHCCTTALACHPIRNRRYRQSPLPVSTVLPPSVTC